MINNTTKQIFTADENRLVKQLQDFSIIKEKNDHEVEKNYPFLQNNELSLLDYMTIRDLREFGDCENDASIFAVLMAMFAMLRQGSLCLTLDRDSLCAKLKLFMQENKAVEIVSEFLSNFEANRYKKLISKNNNDYLPIVFDELTGRKLLYFQKFYVHENNLKNRIQKLLNATTSLKTSTSQVKNLLKEIFSESFSIRVSKNGKQIAKDIYQIEAIKLAINSQFSIISGGPGTGKTSLLVNILRCLVRAGISPSHIILGAPTGRAAQRMTEATHNSLNTINKPSAEDKMLLNLKAGTLHKILKYMRYKHDFYYNETNLLPASVVIVDEASMVDVVMMDKFLRAVDPEKTILIFLGDKDQLPSVNAGAVFADMIPTETNAAIFKDKFIQLKNVYRSGKNLICLSKQINQEKWLEIKPILFDVALNAEQDTWAFVKMENAKKWKQCLYLWAERYYLNSCFEGGKSFKEFIIQAEKMDYNQLAISESGQSILSNIFKVIEKAKILSLIRDGIYGCVMINSLISQYLKFEFDLIEAWKNVFSGAVIVINRNDYSKDLFNGDTGIIIKDTKGIYRAFFKHGGSYVSFSVDSLPVWELAFAITVHKSQGSEFDDVLVVLPENETHRLLTREIVYTGVTRAKKRVLLYGKTSALQTALHNKIDRQSGLTGAV